MAVRVALTSRPEVSAPNGALRCPTAIFEGSCADHDHGRAVIECAAHVPRQVFCPTGSEFREAAYPPGLSDRARRRPCRSANPVHLTRT